MTSLNELEEKIDQLFCLASLNEHVEQYGLVGIGELAIKSIEELEQLRCNSKEVQICRRIVEFLVMTIKQCVAANADLMESTLPPTWKSSGNGNATTSGGNESASFDGSGDDKNSPGKKKRPPTPPKKPKIGRNFHSFQYVPSSKENLKELGASNSSLATTCSNASTKSPPQAAATITGTRTSSTFGSAGNGSAATSSSSSHPPITKSRSMAETQATRGTVTTKYTETCLDRETTTTGDDASPIESKDAGQMSTFGTGRPFAMGSSFGGRKYASVTRTRPSAIVAATAIGSPIISGALTGPGPNSANTKSQNSTPQHNSYPRHLHSTQQFRAQPNSLSSSPAFGQSSLKTPGSLSRNFNYGSNDALNRRFNKMKVNSFDTDHTVVSDVDSLCNGKKIIGSLSGNHSSTPRIGRCHSQDAGPIVVSSRSVAAGKALLNDSSECLNASDDEEPQPSPKSVELEDDDEAIYDTVAPDDETGVIVSAEVGTAVSDQAAYSGRPFFSKQNSLVKSLKNSFENRILAQSMENLDMNTGDANGSCADGRYANYVNIDYFLRSKHDSDECETQMSQSLSSDHDIDESQPMSRHNQTSSSNLLGANTSSLISTSNDSILSEPSIATSASIQTALDPSSANATGGTYDEVFDSNRKESQRSNGRSATIGSASAIDSPMFKYSIESTDDELGDEAIRTEADLFNMYKCIVQSIIESETVYIDCLNTLIQYKKALKSSTESTQPLLRSEQLECIFFQIPQLYQIHCEFLAGVQKLSQSSGDNSIIKIRTNTPTLGDLFKALASRLDVYSTYLKNYSNALQTLHKCCSQSSQFSDIAKVLFSFLCFSRQTAFRSLSAASFSTSSFLKKRIIL